MVRLHGTGDRTAGQHQVAAACADVRTVAGRMPAGDRQAARRLRLLQEPPGGKRPLCCAYAVGQDDCSKSRTAQPHKTRARLLGPDTKRGAPLQGPRYAREGDTCGARYKEKGAPGHEPGRLQQQNTKGTGSTTGLTGRPGRACRPPAQTRAVRNVCNNPNVCNGMKRKGGGKQRGRARPPHLPTPKPAPIKDAYTQHTAAKRGGGLMLHDMGYQARW